MLENPFTREELLRISDICIPLRYFSPAEEAVKDNLVNSSIHAKAQLLRDKMQPDYDDHWKYGLMLHIIGEPPNNWKDELWAMKEGGRNNINFSVPGWANHLDHEEISTQIYSLIEQAQHLSRNCFLLKPTSATASSNGTTVYGTSPAAPLSDTWYDGFWHLAMRHFCPYSCMPTDWMHALDELKNGSAQYFDAHTSMKRYSPLGLYQLIDATAKRMRDAHITIEFQPAPLNNEPHFGEVEVVKPSKFDEWWVPAIKIFAFETWFPNDMEKCLEKMRANQHGYFTPKKVFSKMKPVDQYEEMRKIACDLRNAARSPEQKPLKYDEFWNEAFHHVVEWNDIEGRDWRWCLDQWENGDTCGVKDFKRGYAKMTTKMKYEFIASLANYLRSVFVIK